jgi:hypothetical protein
MESNTVVPGVLAPAPNNGGFILICMCALLIFASVVSAKSIDQQLWSVNKACQAQQAQVQECTVNLTMPIQAGIPVDLLRAQSIYAR